MVEQSGSSILGTGYQIIGEANGQEVVLGRVFQDTPERASRQAQAMLDSFMPGSPVTKLFSDGLRLKGPVAINKTRDLDEFMGRNVYRPTPNGSLQTAKSPV